MQSSPCQSITGSVSVPGDKSISHRALILASQVVGTTRISGLLEGEDVINTAKALELLGVSCKRTAPHEWLIQGVGAGGLHEADNLLDMGNSGTGARLMMGLLTPYPFSTFFTGDHSLRKRPMKRVISPLSLMGAQFIAREEAKLPLVITGSLSPSPIHYTLPVASAQVKTAILLAALNTAGRTTVVEKEATRDHTERMLSYFGWEITVERQENGETAISLSGHQNIPSQDRNITIPADPSSAAFLVVAALITKNSFVTIQNVCINPLRTGLYTTLKEMGADITFTNQRNNAGEEVADIVVRSSTLKAVEVPAERAPSMIDEYPILAVAASFAKGTTKMHGLAELIVKESNRLLAIKEGLDQCGVQAVIEDTSLYITGNGIAPNGNGVVQTHYDHRIAMSFLVMGMATQQPVRIDDAEAITTSFPGFVELMNQMGGRISLTVAPVVVPQDKPAVRPLVIAIDGPASSGKGTLARRLAEHYGYEYLDTGSIYRAVGLKLIYSGNDPYDKRAAITAALSLNEHDLSHPRLRQERIGQAASIISAIPEVRKILLDFQRHFAKNSKGAVLDGRDIGTVVCPDADIKIFITASLETRAQRRHRELQGEGIEVVYESVFEDLRERDERDAARAVAPLIPASDAIMMDTSHLSANDVFLKAVDIINHQQ